MLGYIMCATALDALHYDVTAPRGVVCPTAVAIDCLQVVELLRCSMPSLGNKAVQISGLFPPLCNMTERVDSSGHRWYTLWTADCNHLAVF